MNFMSKWRNFAKFNFDQTRYQSPVGGTAMTRHLFSVLHGHDPHDRLTRYLDRTIATLILVSVTLDMFLDVHNSPKFLLPLVIFLDWIAISTLTIDLILKIITAGLDPRLTGIPLQRLRFLLRPMSLLDLSILAPSLLSMFFPLHLIFMQYFRLFRLAELIHPLMATINVFLRETRGLSLRRRTYRAFFGGERDHGIPGIIDFVVFSIILFSVFLMTLESVDWMRIMYKPKFNALDFLITTVFILEYGCRVYCCVENPKYTNPIFGRINYVLTFDALIDIASISPVFLGFLWETPVPWLWSLRLLRMFKLARYSSSVSIILDVVREERAVLTAAFMMLLLMTIFAASGIYVAEHAAQPEKFSSIPASIYWAVITLTSIGYGDYFPITPIGKILTMVSAVIGLGMIALPAGILANGFSQKIKSNHGNHKHPSSSGSVAVHGPSRPVSQFGPENQTTEMLGETRSITTMDQVLRSEERREMLNAIIHPLTKGEREALIALTAISLSVNRAD